MMKCQVTYYFPPCQIYDLNFSGVKYRAKSDFLFGCGFVFLWLGCDGLSINVVRLAVTGRGLVVILVTSYS